METKEESKRLPLLKCKRKIVYIRSSQNFRRGYKHSISSVKYKEHYHWMKMNWLCAYFSLQNEQLHQLRINRLVLTIALPFIIVKAKKIINEEIIWKRYSDWRWFGKAGCIEEKKKIVDVWKRNERRDCWAYFMLERSSEQLLEMNAAL